MKDATKTAGAPVSAPKKRSNAVVVVTEQDGVMTFTVDGQGSVSVDTKALHPAKKARALLAGVKQRVSDAAALPFNNDTGKPATPAEKFAAMKAVADNLNADSPEWNVKREGGFGRDTGGIILQALATIKKTTVPDVEKMVGVLAARQGIEVAAVIKRLGQSPDVIREIAAIKAARVDVDADDLLDELK